MSILCVYRAKLPDFLNTFLQGSAVSLLAFILLLWHCQSVLQWTLPKPLEGKTITVIGNIASIPEAKQRGVSFLFHVQRFNHQAINTRVMLRWYSKKNQRLQFSIGDRWQLQVRLKRPHSLENPGSFDYARGLFQKGIRATGYLVIGHNTYRHASHWYVYPIGRIRQAMQANITRLLKNKPLTGIIIALTIGEKNGITPSQWQILQNTGTSHLVAISGLHIGLIASVVFFLLRFVWRQFTYLSLRFAAPRAAAIASIIGALGYSALAGFSIPTQRAFVMVAVFMAMIVFRRQLISWQAFSMALLMVLLLQPLSVLSMGFWLSFTAVAVLIYALAARVRLKGFYWKIIRPQYAVVVGLLPLTLLFFHQASLVSPIANVIAIPWVSFVTVPLSLLGALLSLVLPSLAYYFLAAAQLSLYYIWQLLTYLTGHPLFIWQHAVNSGWLLIFIVAGVALLLAPRGIPGRWLGIVCFLPLFWQTPSAPRNGVVWLTLLDVGQGLSAVVQTQHHVLVFDTGAKYSDSFDMGKAVVVPYLLYRGIHQVSMLMISHGDNDHIGGAHSLISQLTVQQIKTSVPRRFKKIKATYCLAGQHWQWDGVLFNVLYPSRHFMNDKTLSKNDLSCVLRISVGNTHILLTGDIEAAAERYLVTHQAAQLRANILIAPHHGSRTSSTQAFIRAVQPDDVLFPVGYRNRFHFPNWRIVKRYRAIEVQQYNTASDGAISFVLSAQQPIAKPILFRKIACHIWQICQDK
ncbi:MAG: DNA internalization-related competence protein ComEC/Rec2 [Gammaproteobacteria bacterium]|nr:DNA internalization-related competence protein ComEC/Rec2 [Gammaproteobacteria bacterium]